jgi:hypothetical protein
MRKRLKNVRPAKKVAPVFSPAEMRALTRLKKSVDASYSNFWWVALGINKPPKPPRIDELVNALSESKLVDHLARILPPPRPPF